MYLNAWYFLQYNHLTVLSTESGVAVGTNPWGVTEQHHVKTVRPSHPNTQWMATTKPNQSRPGQARPGLPRSALQRHLAEDQTNSLLVLLSVPVWDLVSGPGLPCWQRRYQLKCREIEFCSACVLQSVSPVRGAERRRDRGGNVGSKRMKEQTLLLLTSSHRPWQVICTLHGLLIDGTIPCNYCIAVS